MKAKFIITLLIVILGTSLFQTAIFAASNDLVVVTSASPSLSPTPTATPTVTPTSPTATSTPVPEPGLSDVINQQITDLRDNLKSLETIRESVQTPENIKNEVAARQSALFKIVDISLNENTQTLNTISQIKDLNLGVMTELDKVIESDNKWYQKFILQINLTSNINDLKKLATTMQVHREEVRGLSIRRLVGMILVLQEFNAINTAQVRAETIKNDLENINSSVRQILGTELEKALQGIDTAYQLARSSQLRLENMTAYDDFEYARDWLERANDSLKTVYQIFEQIADKAK